MIVINFSHPVTPAQRDVIAALASETLVQVIDVATHFDHARSFAEQAAILVDQIGLSAAEWGATPVAVNLPAFAAGAAAVLAELHGRLGHFPSIVRLRPVPETNPPRYEPAELVNLQASRDDARARRFR